jgi:UDP-N-acetylmuramoyl-tripeptide--D-alanyl-D-alanine ligase
MSLWHAEEVLRAVGGRGPGGWQAAGVSIDSRTLAAGDLFIALRGPRHDGHAFLADAFARGAVAAVVAADAAVPEVGPLVRVDDPMAALEALGRAARDRSRARIVALTGSVGKTGTKEALRHVLGAMAPTHASAASHNNHWGVPLSLARMPKEAAFAVFELGMNHPGEIRHLVAQVRPQVALITWVAAAHIGFFPNEAAIAAAKAEIFEVEPPPDVAVLPADNAHVALLLEVAQRAGIRQILRFGTAVGCDVRMTGLRLAASGSEVEAEVGGKSLSFRLRAPGRHWAMNALAVLATVLALGGDVANAAAALSDFELPSGRGRRLELRLPGGGTALLLDDSYNANPESMRAALAVLALQPGRRIAVLGDMAELGAHAAELHAGLAPAVEAADVAEVHLCGTLMRHLYEALPARLRGILAPDAKALLPHLRTRLQPGDVVLIKGSNVSGMALLVEALLAPTPEEAG